MPIELATVAAFTVVFGMPLLILLPLTVFREFILRDHYHD
jgi:hypothetical protein